MNVSKSQLKKVIKEEYDSLMQEQQNQKVLDWFSQVSNSGAENSLKTYIDISNNLRFVTVNPNEPNYGLVIVDSQPQIVEATDSWLSEENFKQTIKSLERVDILLTFPYKSAEAAAAAGAGRALGGSEDLPTGGTIIQEEEINEAPPGGQKKRVPYDDPVRRKERERRRKKRREKYRGTDDAPASRLKDKSKVGKGTFADRKAARKMALEHASQMKRHNKLMRDRAAEIVRIEALDDLNEPFQKRNPLLRGKDAVLDQIGNYGFGGGMALDDVESREMSKVQRLLNKLNYKWNMVDRMGRQIPIVSLLPGDDASLINAVDPDNPNRKTVSAMTDRSTGAPLSDEAKADRRKIARNETKKVRAELDRAIDARDLTPEEAKKIKLEIDEVELDILRKAKPSAVVKGFSRVAKAVAKFTKAAGPTLMWIAAAAAAYFFAGCKARGATDAEAAALTAAGEADPTLGLTGYEDEVFERLEKRLREDSPAGAAARSRAKQYELRQKAAEEYEKGREKRELEAYPNEGYGRQKRLGRKFEKILAPLKLSFLKRIKKL
jgi:hypothetical protein